MRQLLAYLALVLLCGCKEEARFPPIEVMRLDRAIETLPASDGRIQVINIWASWCAPCRAELASLERLAIEHQRDILVHGIALGDDPDLVREYLRDAGITFARHADPERRLKQLLPDLDLVPLTYIIDTQGRMRERVEGAREWDSTEMVTLLEAYR